LTSKAKTETAKAETAKAETAKAERTKTKTERATERVKTDWSWLPLMRRRRPQT
jgi:hypothetical protein